ncbi:MAG TPA: hypothetical protein VFS67_00535 [Polyangiaceae bacterium]|jgi:hypothetical protein|nr:hypothetical protein [Polyangiaceae bacterium]
MRRVGVVLALSVALGGCGGKELVLVKGAHWEPFVYDSRREAPEPLAAMVFREKVCAGRELAPQYSRLDENDLLDFLRSQQLPVRVERPRTDLSYVLVDDPRTRAPARLRVAILQDADQAGRELAEALVQHGQGAWGVHRSNLAVLGPVGDPTHDLVFAAQIGLVCWGVFTVRGREDTFVIPGGYREL